MGEATAGVMYGPEDMLKDLDIDRPILLEKVKVWKERLLPNEKKFIHLGNIECGALRLRTAQTPCTACTAPCTAPRTAPRTTPMP